MELLKLAGFCVACLLPVLLLRKGAPEQSLLLTAAVLVFVLLRCLGAAVPQLERLRTLFAQAGMETAYIPVLLRTLAAALVTRLCADMCKDGGSQAMASAVEMAGAVTVLLVALPLLEAVVGLLLGCFT